MDWHLVQQSVVSGLLAVVLQCLDVGRTHEHGHHGSVEDGEKPTGFHDHKVVQDAEYVSLSCIIFIFGNEKYSKENN